MYNFKFQNPTKLIFGKGMIAELAKEIPQDRHILITFGGGSVRNNGVYDQVKKALANHRTEEFWGIEPNPKYETLMQAVKLGREKKIDFILAVGGGSVVDGSKFIAAAIPYEGDEPWDLVSKHVRVTTTVPLATVITLPATGSEMNCGAVISRKSTMEKLVLSTPLNFPKFSILDPEVTFSLPRTQIAAGLIDTFIHTMEQYLTFPVDAKLMDRWAEGILQTVIETAPRAMDVRPDYDTMANYMLTATMALNDFIAMGVPQDWATHMIGHEITAFTEITHGYTLAIVFPQLLRVMKDEKRDKILQYGARVWGITVGSVDERIDAIIDRTEMFFRSLGVKTKLSDYGVCEDIIAKIVTRFELRGTVLGENKTITPEKVEKILTMAF
ncbi:MAG: iron-containing alcohol dehydrogenase [Bacteroidales bacterium]|nr:iron-containing alcohol dehydrogenase [Bacteroidales bacterium]